MTFESTHKLSFYNRPWLYGWQEFSIGTVKGTWRDGELGYEILGIINHQPGNGHLQDVFEWFENSCKRDHKNLAVLEIWNKRFARHLIEKRGFTLIGENAIKTIFS